MQEPVQLPCAVAVQQLALKARMGRLVLRRGGAAFLLSDMGEIGIFGDLTQPHIQAAPAVESIQMGHGLAERFLRDLLGGVNIPAQGQDVLVHAVEVSGVDLLEIRHFLTSCL